MAIVNSNADRETVAAGGVPMISEKISQQGPVATPGQTVRCAHAARNANLVRAIEFDISGRAIQMWSADEGGTAGA